MYDLQTIKRMNQTLIAPRRATTSPNLGTVSKDTLILALCEARGFNKDELQGIPFEELKDLVTKVQVWGYIKHTNKGR